MLRIRKRLEQLTAHARWTKAGISQQPTRGMFYLYWFTDIIWSVLKHYIQLSISVMNCAPALTKIQKLKVMVKHFLCKSWLMVCGICIARKYNNDTQSNIWKVLIQRTVFFRKQVIFSIFQHQWCPPTYTDLTSNERY